MLRDISMAYFFGTSPAIAAFFVAYRLSHLFRRVFAEGGLLNGFIPFYEGKRRESDLSAMHFFRDLFWSLGLSLIVLILLLEGAIVIAIFCFGVQNFILFLTALMLPSLLFICLYGLFSAYLHCQNRFFMSGFAPVIFNLVWILSAFALRHMGEEKAAICLSIAISCAFLCQWLFIMWGSPHLKQKEWFNIKLFTPSIKEMIAPFLIAALGVSAAQINSALDALFARLASIEGPAYLIYAIRIQQIPLVFFAIAIATVLLPSLAKSYQEGQMNQFKEYLQHAISRALFFLIPSTMGILCVGSVIINVIFGHGHFNTGSLIHTTECFWGYGLSLIPSALVIIIAPAFFAQKNYKTPTLIACISIGMNIFLNTFLICYLHLGVYSVAISTAVCAFFNAIMLISSLKKKVGTLFSGELSSTIFKVSCSSCIASCASILSAVLSNHQFYLPFMNAQNLTFPNTISEQLVSFATPFFTFIIFFFFSCIIFKTKMSIYSPFNVIK